MHGRALGLRSPYFRRSAFLWNNSFLDERRFNGQRLLVQERRAYHLSILHYQSGTNIVGFLFKHVAK